MSQAANTAKHAHRNQTNGLPIGYAKGNEAGYADTYHP